MNNKLNCSGEKHTGMSAQLIYKTRLPISIIYNGKKNNVILNYLLKFKSSDNILLHVS